MNAHLASAAAVLEQFGGGYTAMIARDLARSWRRAFVIAERTGAADDTQPACAAPA